MTTSNEHDLTEIDEDLPSILASELTEYRANVSYSFLPWINNKRIILEAEAVKVLINFENV